MDREAYEKYEAYGTFHDAQGSPLTCRKRRNLDHLTPAEFETCTQITDLESPRTRRIEQERIPLAAGLMAIEARLRMTSATTRIDAANLAWGRHRVIDRIVERVVDRSEKGSAFRS